MSELLFKSVGIAIIAASAAVCLKPYKSEYSLFISVAASVAIFTGALFSVFPFIRKIQDIMNESSFDSSYFLNAVKCLGIAYITSFASDICRDFGESSLAAKTEFAGKCAVFIICVPMLTDILETAVSLTKL